MDKRFQGISEQLRLSFGLEESYDVARQVLERYEFLSDLLREDIEYEDEGEEDSTISRRLVLRVTWTRDSKVFSVPIYRSLLMESPLVRTLDSSDSILTLQNGPFLITSIDALSDVVFPFLCGGLPLFDRFDSIAENYLVLLDLYNFFHTLRMPTWCRLVVEFASAMPDEHLCAMYEAMVREYGMRASGSGITLGLARALWRCADVFPWDQCPGLRSTVLALVKDKMEVEWLEQLHQHSHFCGLREAFIILVPRSIDPVILVTGRTAAEEEEESSDMDVFGAFSLFGDDSDEEKKEAWETDIRKPSRDYVVRLCQSVGNAFAFESLEGTTATEGGGGGNLRLSTATSSEEGEEGEEDSDRHAHLEILMLNSELFFRSVKFHGSEKEEFRKTGRMCLQVLDDEMLSAVVDDCYGRAIDDFPLGTRFRLIPFAVMFSEWELLVRVVGPLRGLSKEELFEYGHILENRQSQDVVAARVEFSRDEAKQLMRDSRKEERSREQRQDQRRLISLVEDLTEKVGRQEETIAELKGMLQAVLEKIS